MTLHFAIGDSTPSDFYLGVGSGLASNNLASGQRVVPIAPRNDIASVYTL